MVIPTLLLNKGWWESDRQHPVIEKVQVMEADSPESESQFSRLLAVWSVKDTCAHQTVS